MTGKTATEGLYQSRKLKRKLTSWTNDTRFDAVMVVCSSMIQYLASPGPGRGANGSRSDRRRQPKMVGLRRKRPWAEKDSLPLGRPSSAAVGVFASRSSRGDHSRYRPGGGPFQDVPSRLPSNVLRNGVDLDYFQPQPSETSTQPPTPNTQPPTPDTRHPTPDTRHPTPNTRHPTPKYPDTRHPTPDTRHPDTRHPTRHPTPVFVGALDYQANVDGAAWFCQKSGQPFGNVIRMPYFQLVGSRPNKEARRLGTR